MKAFKTLAIVLFAATAITLSVRADEKPAANEANKESAFDKIKALNGEWEADGRCRRAWSRLRQRDL